MLRKKSATQNTVLLHYKTYARLSIGTRLSRSAGELKVFSYTNSCLMPHETWNKNPASIILQCCCLPQHTTAVHHSPSCLWEWWWAPCSPRTPCSRCRRRPAACWWPGHWTAHPASSHRLLSRSPRPPSPACVSQQHTHINLWLETLIATIVRMSAATCDHQLPSFSPKQRWQCWCSLI